MFETFYGLREKPFNQTPDPKFLYLSEKHKEAFAHLLYGIKNRTGFVMLTGEIGTGKTTICRNLLSQLDSDTELAFIFNPFLSPIELLRKINTEFGIDTQADNLLGLTEELNVHLLNAGVRGKNCVLVIDEAQNLDVKVLEQIRLLSNLETESSKLIQIILIGQPELAEKLDLHELRQLNQRITARYHLKPLNEAETLQYVAYRIHVAGGRKTVSFSKNAIRQVYKLSGGTPRVVNAICDRALLIGYTREEHIITADIVRQAAREIKGEKVTVNRPQSPRAWTRWMPSPTAVLIAVLFLIIVQLLLNPVDRVARGLAWGNHLPTVEAPVAASVQPTPPPASEVAAAEKPTAPAPPPAPAVAEAALAPAPESAPAPVAAPAPDAKAELPPAAESIIARRVIDQLAAVSATHAVPPPDPTLKSLEELAGLTPEASRDAGLTAVLKAWGVENPSGFAGGDTPEGLTHFFQGRGFACESLRSGTVQLVAMNLPALVRVKLKDQARWVALVQADEERVSLALDGDRKATLGRVAFRDIYQNEAVIPWRDSTPDTPVLLPGQKGAPVLTLKKQLRALGLIGGTNTQDAYDNETASAVTALQAETGLKMDGKVGKQVRMVLASWTGAGNAPSLRPRGTLLPADDATPAPGVSAKQEEKPAVAAPAPEPVPAPAPDPAPAAPAAAPVAEAAKSEAPVPAAQPEAAKPETPVAAPQPEAAKPEETPPPADSSEKKEQAAAAQPAGENRADTGTPLQVRELPPPTAMEPLPPADTVRPGESTEPVAGSSPLVPHNGAAA